MTDFTRKQVIEWCIEKQCNFKDPVYPPPDGWMWVGVEGRGVYLQSIFTNDTEEAERDVTMYDIIAKLYVATTSQPLPECRQRLAAEGKPYPRSNCAVCGPFSPRWRECDKALGTVDSKPASVIPWMQLLDSLMVTMHLGTANEDDSYSTASDKLGQLIRLHEQMATDPAVNGGKVLVDKVALERLLSALLGPAHYIREIQATRSPAEIFPDNPINVLLADLAANGGTKG